MVAGSGAWLDGSRESCHQLPWVRSSVEQPDAIATQVNYDTWVDLSTIANATTIAGERGGAMRDLKDGRKMIARFREIQDHAKKSCFLDK